MSDLNLDVQSKWWGDFDVTHDTKLLLECADLHLQLVCSDKEWLVKYELASNETPHNGKLSYIDIGFDQGEFDKQQRFVFKKLPKQLIIQPALADRPVICWSTTTVMLLPKQEILLYVTIPLWLQLSISSVKKPLIDIPTVRISDTWFGPNTQEGVIGYASRATDQLNADLSENHGLKATIAVKIKNLSNNVLALDKISVPSPNLDLYVDKSGQFWTRRITLIKEQDDSASLTIDEVMTANLDKKDLTLVAKARDDLGKNKITKALWALFG